MNLFDNNSGAEFSQCGKYRYKLWRIWDNDLPLAMCIGLNPSTANANKNDQTINYLVRMLKRLRYGGFYMMNCWPFISSNPELIERNKISDEWNDDIITVTASLCKDIIFCWGGFKIITDTGRDKELISMFPNAKCFGISAGKTPFHPLAMMPRNGHNPDEAELFLYTDLIK